ncbi:hypothetical protein [Trinickia sp.]|uniref:hypothetical protein n=1 Tax=Trinickia sp. TaxID=2571163 RepID=UPI003F7E096C
MTPRRLLRKNLLCLKAAQINLQAADGNIYAMGGNHSAVRVNGTATRGGHVWLVADSGLVQTGGCLARTMRTARAAPSIPSPLGLELALAQPHRDAKLERELP